MILHAPIADPEARDLWSDGEWSVNRKRPCDQGTKRSSTMLG
jgi:hypothetical protein